MKNLTLLLFCSFIIFQSCGNDKKPRSKDDSTSVTSAPDQSQSNILKFEINGDFTDSDNVIIFWRPKEIGWFEEKNTVQGGTNGYPGNQTIKFELPEKSVPVDFRLDISSNNNQKGIKINFIKVEKGKREFYVFGDELDSYFTFNEFINYDKTSKKLTFKSVNGNYDPFLNTTKKFIDEYNRVFYNY